MKKSNQEIKLFVLCGLLITLLVAAPMGGKLYTKWRADKEKAALLAKKQAQAEKELLEMQIVPTFGGPKLGLDMAKSSQHFPIYDVVVAVSNAASSFLKIKVNVEKGRKEFLHPDKSGKGFVLSGMTVPSGQTPIGVTLGWIGAKRKETIVIRFDWTRGKKSGVKRFVITPQQKPY